MNDISRARGAPPEAAIVDGFDAAQIRIADKVVEGVDADSGQHLFGLARRAGLDDQSAEDAVQETLVRLWIEVRSGTDVLDPAAWSFRTLYRIAMDYHRLRRRVSELVERIGRRPLHPVGDSLEHMTVWSLVDQLPLRQRQVMYLRYRADLTFEEIGLIMAITASGARAHAAKAKTSLRRSLGAEVVD